MRAVPHDLVQLTERVRAIEQAGGGGGASASQVVTGWTAVDAALGGGLVAGVVHEWFGGEPAGPGQAADEAPPLTVLMHLARQAMGGGPRGGWCVWVGRGCWPHPHGLVDEQAAVLERCLWVDPPTAAFRVWAIDLAARCAGVAVVVADGSGLDMAATRRLQLAAEAGGTLVLLARPAKERVKRSAASTRWAVTPAVSDTNTPRWELALWRCKGVQQRVGQEGQQTVWWLEGKHTRGKGLVVIPTAPDDRPPPEVAPSEAAEPGPASPSVEARQRRA
ncbi:ImuA family protein [Phycisphaerales bacterium AB-hyl4]|uniref:ImuA family protein n=1 Tax=Natronomicrosphaera hydrolytica TaxID=3242702 RepID=A0ABV4U3R4_9BACT